MRAGGDRREATEGRLRTWPVVAAVNAAIKAQAMERDVIRTRRRYEGEARRRNLTVVAADGIRDALRHRLGDRPSGWGGRRNAVSCISFLPIRFTTGRQCCPWRWRRSGT